MPIQLIDGPAGLLEVCLQDPLAGAPSRRAMVMCHPHPVHGGTMTNKVVTSVCQAFHDLHYVTLRFNFRGVDQSQGRFDDGVGELADALTVIEWLKQERDIEHLVLAGFSFGAYIALAASHLISVQHLLLIAPPTHYPDFADITPKQSWGLITAGLDEVVSTPAINAWAQRQPAMQWQLSIDDASHFFHGKLNILKNFVATHYAEGP
jgi:alpha/beta superfamily hydrolase